MGSFTSNYPDATEAASRAPDSLFQEMAVLGGGGGRIVLPDPALPSYRHLCRPCHSREKAKSLGKFICQRCHLAIDEQPLMFKNDPYHPDHFSCSHCG